MINIHRNQTAVCARILSAALCLLIALSCAVKTGYAYEYYRKLSEYTGWRYEYVYGDYTDLYQKLLSGEIDMLAGLAKNKEREPLIGYPESKMGNTSYCLIKHGSDNEITSDPASLNGHTIGVLESAVSKTLESYLKEHNVKAAGPVRRF